MRMWNVPPRLMCRQHLLGEHVEMHMFIGTLRRGTSIQGYIETGLVEPHRIARRHDELVKEMKRRGYNHKSPLIQPIIVPSGRVNAAENLQELFNRCKACRKRIRTEEANAY